ncbi:MAG: HK97 family phage prohead protease [Sagittula sp.]|uniref:HK97 family phage prohead protease n=1 Tax=Sagittula sp. TaxID=2038081 RepID=UPI004059B0D7
MSNQHETKFLCAKIAPDPDTGSISGYGAIFGNKDQGGDIVAAGAFRASLAAGRPVKMLWQHDPNKPIGVWDEVSEDTRGLRVKGRVITETEAGREAMALVRAGAINGLSIGYRTKMTQRGTDGARIITEAELWEVSLVTFPMNEQATITDVKRLTCQADVARLLKSSGLPNRAAEKIASGGWPALRGDELTESETKNIAALLTRAASNLKG